MTQSAQTNQLNGGSDFSKAQVDCTSRLIHEIRASDPGLDIEDAFPLLSWFHDQVSWIRDPDNSSSYAYNLPIVLRIKGALVQSSLIAAAQEAQRRHQSLRSLYRLVDGEPVQIVLRPRFVHVPITSLEQNVASDSVIERIVRREASRPFELGCEPAFRLTLLKFSATDHVLVITTHHVVCDDWSTGILARQILEIYEAIESFNASPLLPPPSFQYSDFIRWQQEQLTEKGLQSRLSFWRNYLAGKDEGHYLSTDRPRSAVRTWTGATLKEVLPQDLTTSLKQLAQRERVSLFMVLLAAFNCLLRRQSGAADISIGSCAANRSFTAAEVVVGRFANDLIIRTDFSGCETFRELLSRVRTQALTVYSYQDLPFAKLIDELEPGVPPNRNPLFQAMFILQDAPKDKLDCSGLDVTRLSCDVGTAKYDLCVFVGLSQGIELALEYNSSLFDRTTIERLFAQYQKILGEMASNPAARVDETPTAAPSGPTLVSSAETRKTVSRKNDPILIKLTAIWETGFGIRPIGMDDDFFELGGDSLLASRLFAQIKSVFNVSIPIVTLVQAPTIRKLADVLRKSSTPLVTSCCTVLLQNEGSRPPLFCAHGQSGNLLMYRDFAKYLGPEQPVYGLQPIGLDGRRPPLTRIEEMASNYVREIQSIQPRGPYFLAGYCMGGLIALEMATQLRRKGHSIGLVAMIDTYNVGLMKSSLLDKVIYSLQKYWFGIKHFSRTDSRYKLTYLKRRLNEFASPSSEVSAANEVAALSYVPSRYPGSILHIVPAHQYVRYKRPQLAWDDVVTGGAEEFVLPIYPGQMFEETYARKLAAKVNEYIAQRVGDQIRRGG